MTHKDIGQAIHDLRIAKGITQDDLAQAIGCPRSAITFIEQGERKVSLVEAIAAVTYILSHTTNEQQTQKLLRELVEIDAVSSLHGLSDESKDYLETLYYMFLPPTE